MQDMLRELRVVLASVAPEVRYGEFTENTSLRDDIGLDSLQMMLFAVGVEDNFDIRFKGEPVIRTIGDIAEYIINYRKGVVISR